MVTLEQAQTVGTFYHKVARNRDGSAVRCRANGKCKTWKTRPGEFRLPVKYGLRDYFYITNGNAREWLIADPTSLADLAWTANLDPGAPEHFVLDKLLEDGLEDVVEAYRACHSNPVV